MEWRATDNRKTRRAALKTPEGQRMQAEELDRRLDAFYRGLNEPNWGVQEQPSTPTDVTPA